MPPLPFAEPPSPSSFSSSLGTPTSLFFAAPTHSTDNSIPSISTLRLPLKLSTAPSSMSPLSLSPSTGPIPTPAPVWRQSLRSEQAIVMDDPIDWDAVIIPQLGDKELSEAGGGGFSDFTDQTERGKKGIAGWSRKMKVVVGGGVVLLLLLVIGMAAGLGTRNGAGQDKAEGASFGGATTSTAPHDPTDIAPSATSQDTVADEAQGSTSSAEVGRGIASVGASVDQQVQATSRGVTISSSPSFSASASSSSSSSPGPPSTSNSSPRATTSPAEAQDHVSSSNAPGTTSPSPATTTKARATSSSPEKAPAEATVPRTTANASTTTRTPKPSSNDGGDDEDSSENELKDENGTEDEYEGEPAEEAHEDDYAESDSWDGEERSGRREFVRWSAGGRSWDHRRLARSVAQRGAAARVEERNRASDSPA